MGAFTLLFLVLHLVSMRTKSSSARRSLSRQAAQRAFTGMIANNQDIVFIIAAYVGVGAVTLGLIGWVLAAIVANQAHGSSGALTRRASAAARPGPLLEPIRCASFSASLPLVGPRGADRRVRPRHPTATRSGALGAHR